VTGVVALAPWCPADEPAAHLAGRSVLMLHGDRDRLLDPEDTRRFALRARAAGARTAGYRVTGSGHALLRRAAAWHRSTAGLTAGLLGLRPLPAEVTAALALTAPHEDGLALAI
jgi:predicted esterase